MLIDFSCYHGQADVTRLLILLTAGGRLDIHQTGKGHTPHMIGGTDLIPHITGETGLTPHTIAIEAAIHAQGHTLPATVGHRLVGDHGTITLLMVDTTGGADIGATLGAIHQGEGAPPEGTLQGQGEVLGGVTLEATHPGQGDIPGGATLAATPQGQGGARGGVTVAVCLEAPGGVSPTLPRSVDLLGLDLATVTLQGATRAGVHLLGLDPLRGLPAQEGLPHRLAEVAKNNLAS